VCGGIVMFTGTVLDELRNKEVKRVGINSDPRRYV